MQFFVTGATGWVGSAIVQQLLATGHEVLSLVRFEATKQTPAHLGWQSTQPDLLADLANYTVS